MADTEKLRYQTLELKVIHVIGILDCGSGKGEDLIAEERLF